MNKRHEPSWWEVAVALIIIMSLGGIIGMILTIFFGPGCSS